MKSAVAANTDKMGIAAAAGKTEKRFEHRPFGSEYSESPRWGLPERLYIRFFGTVDLPSRMRARRITGVAISRLTAVAQELNRHHPGGYAIALISQARLFCSNSPPGASLRHDKP